VNLIEWRNFETEVVPHSGSEGKVNAGSEQLDPHHRIVRAFDVRVARRPVSASTKPKRNAAARFVSRAWTDVTATVTCRRECLRETEERA
jgi:hypothetical protein